MENNKVLSSITSRIKGLLVKTTKTFYELGKEFFQAREILKEEKGFLEWLKKEFNGLGQRTVYRWIQIYRAFQECPEGLDGLTQEEAISLIETGESKTLVARLKLLIEAKKIAQRAKVKSQKDREEAERLLENAKTPEEVEKAHEAKAKADLTEKKADNVEKKADRQITKVKEEAKKTARATVEAKKAPPKPVEPPKPIEMPVPYKQEVPPVTLEGLRNEIESWARQFAREIRIMVLQNYGQEHVVYRLTALMDAIAGEIEDINKAVKKAA